ncbi:MAG: E3 binding domain-containing protein, partial [Rhodoferax sp.]|nr:E3 binding domain-containing protein [Rhodoferax sp.]
MANHTVKMPDLGEGITEVEVVAWHVQVGDTVTEDQVLADVMTDKATVEIPSPVAGSVARLGGEVGDVLAVGAALIDIAVDGDGDGDGAVASAPAGPIPAPAAPAAPSAPARDAPPRTDAASRAPAPNAASPSATTQQAAAPRAPAVSDGDEKPIASPAVRRRAWELGVDLRQVRASGAGGRIMQADLDAHVARHGRSPAEPAGAAAAAAAVPARAGEDTLQEIKVIGLRRRIAQKMQESKRRIPHFAYVEECDVTELESLRAQLNRRFGDSRGKL